MHFFCNFVFFYELAVDEVAVSNEMAQLQQVVDYELSRVAAINTQNEMDDHYPKQFVFYRKTPHTIASDEAVNPANALVPITKHQVDQNPHRQVQTIFTTEL